jgi:hypothetical protein
MIVGGGYAIRGVAGLALAVDLGGRPDLIIAAVLTMWSFGIAFVTLRWTLEALPFARAEGRSLTWIVSADHAREHTLALTRWLPRTPPDAASGDWSPAKWHPLAGRTSWAAPWNVATTVSAAASVAAGLLLNSVSDPFVLLLGAALGGALAAAVINAPRRRLALGIAAGLLVVATAEICGATRPAAAALPWVLVTATHLLFAAQSSSSLGQPVRSLLRGRAGSVDPASPANTRLAPTAARPG